MYDLIIIGSGPAGLTAAIYAKRANLNVCVFEKNAPGGQMVNTFKIDNYPGYDSINGVDLALNMFNQVINMGVEVMFEDVVSIKEGFTVTTSENTYEAKNVLIATGRVPKSLDVKNEGKFLGSKISYCAICDGTFYKNKDVIVVGGGNSAIEEALYLSSICKEVTVLVRNKIRAERNITEQLTNKSNVRIMLGTKIEEFIDEDGFKGALTNNGVIKADGCFEYVGNVPKTEFLNGLGVTNEEGYLIVDQCLETSVRGLYGAGDCIVKELRQIVTATNDGALAVTNIIKNRA